MKKIQSPGLRVWAAVMVLLAMLMGSLPIFTFGAVCFAGLFLLWLKEERSKADRFESKNLVNGLMLLLCVVWFIANILVEFLPTRGMILFYFLIALLFPPLIAHLFYNETECHGGVRRSWKIGLAGIYASSVALILGYVMIAFGVVQVDILTSRYFPMMSMSALFVVAGIFSVYLLTKCPRQADRQRTGQARMNLTLLGGMIAMFVVSSFAFYGRVEAVSDFLGIVLRSVPLFFLFVNEYYKDRFGFYDVFVKRATLFFCVLSFLTIYFRFLTPLLEAAGLDPGIKPYASALAILPLVMAVPWGYRRLENLLDRSWLGRTFSPVEAVKFFLEGIRDATTVDELVLQTEDRLAKVFQTSVAVRLEGKGQGQPSFEVVQEVAIESGGARAGSLLLGPRPNQTPYFIQDISLIKALADVFSYLLQNLQLQERKQIQEKREQELVLDASRSQLKALRAQINPHFLFNALNVIASLTQRDPDRAEETVEQLAEVFRYTLSRSEQEWVRVEDEMEFIRAYLEVEKARFGERLQVSFRIDKGAGERLIPTMMVQTLVENAVKHGIAALKGVARIGVEARTRGDNIEIRVSDNGRGIGNSTEDAAKGLGYGLENIRNRLKGYFGDAARLSLERDKRSGLTVATIQCPVLAGSSKGAQL